MGDPTIIVESLISFQENSHLQRKQWTTYQHNNLWRCLWDCWSAVLLGMQRTDLWSDCSHDLQQQELRHLCDYQDSPWELQHGCWEPAQQSLVFLTLKRSNDCRELAGFLQHLVSQRSKWNDYRQLIKNIFLFNVMYIWLTSSLWGFSRPMQQTTEINFTG